MHTRRRESRCFFSCIHIYFSTLSIMEILNVFMFNTWRYRYEYICFKHTFDFYVLELSISHAHVSKILIYPTRIPMLFFFHLLTNTKILTSHKSSSSRYTYIQERPHIFINNRVELPQRDTWRQEMKRDLLQVNIHISYIYMLWVDGHLNL